MIISKLALYRKFNNTDKIWYIIAQIKNILQGFCHEIKEEKFWWGEKNLSNLKKPKQFSPQILRKY